MYDIESENQFFYFEYKIMINGDPWTFTETIKVYNWESHPDWDLNPYNPETFYSDIRERKIVHSQMTEYKRILDGYGCLEWSKKLKRNFFHPNDKWLKNKVYPVVLPDTVKELYTINFPTVLPVMVSGIEKFREHYIQVTGTWKIYYYGGSDVGSIYVNTFDKYNEHIESCKKYQFIFMYFPGVVINNPPFPPNPGVDLLHKNICNYKLPN